MLVMTVESAEAPLASANMRSGRRREARIVESRRHQEPKPEDVRRRAGKLLAVHPLRAADSLQLATALVFCEDDPTGESFVCLDDRLRDAAMSEGFQLLPS